MKYDYNALNSYTFNAITEVMGAQFASIVFDNKICSLLKSWVSNWH